MLEFEKVAKSHSPILSLSSTNGPRRNMFATVTRNFNYTPYFFYVYQIFAAMM